MELEGGVGVDQVGWVAGVGVEGGQQEEGIVDREEYKPASWRCETARRAGDKAEMGSWGDRAGKLHGGQRGAVNMRLPHICSVMGKNCTVCLHI